MTRTRQMKRIPAALVLVVVLAACGGGGSKASSGGSSSDATLKIRDQAAQRKTKSAADFIGANDGDGLAIGDSVRTNGTGFAQVNYHDGSLTRLDANAQFTLTDLAVAQQSQRVVGKLDGGRAWSNVQKITSSEGRYEIDTDVATASVRGTQFNVDCTAADKSCTFTVANGTVTVTPTGGQPIDLHAGDSLTVHPDHTTTKNPTLSAPQLLADPWIGKNIGIDLREANGSNSSGSAAGTPTVDLVFTGSRSFTAKGNEGRCPTGGSSFGFEATEADYPGLGQSFSVAELSPGFGDIKWVIDDTTAYLSSANSTITISADHRSVQIDDELGHPPATGPEHVHGTITCPGGSSSSGASGSTSGTKPLTVDACTLLTDAEVETYADAISASSEYHSVPPFTATPSGPSPAPQCTWTFTETTSDGAGNTEGTVSVGIARSASGACLGGSDTELSGIGDNATVDSAGVAACVQSGDVVTNLGYSGVGGTEEPAGVDAATSLLRALVTRVGKG